MQQHTSSSRQIPSYRLPKPSGLGVVRLDGRDIYLGKHGPPESQAEYRRVIAEWLVSPVQTQRTPLQKESVTDNSLVLVYLNHAKLYYTKNGRPTGEINNLKDAAKPLVLIHGHCPVREFSPVSLKAVRSEMIKADLSRKVINARINRIRRVFRWGVENVLVTPSILHCLQAVSSLKRRRCESRETFPVSPVPEALIEGVLSVAPPQIGAMIQLQLLTGMRPGEVVRMRGCDIDISQSVWVYTPCEHKTEHHGRSRVIHLGPQAQAILGAHLKSDPEALVFSSRDVSVFRSRTKRASRVTPLPPSQRDRTTKLSPNRTPGNCYTTGSYARAILYAFDRAMPHPLLRTMKYSTLNAEKQGEVDAWRRQYRWSPTQLRHNAAALLHKRSGIEAAWRSLGTAPPGSPRSMQSRASPKPQRS